jgi:hypothetical protein
VRLVSAYRVQCKLAYGSAAEGPRSQIEIFPDPHQLLNAAGASLMIISLRDAGRLLPELNYATARDIFWMLSGSDVYRMLVRDRGWSPQKYQDWLADTLVKSLLIPGRATPLQSRKGKRDASRRT